MAEFAKAYKKLEVAEGGYVNDLMMQVEKLIKVFLVKLILIGLAGLY